MRDNHRQNDGDFKWIVDNDGNRLDDTTNNAGSLNDHRSIQSIDDTPRSVPNFLALALFGPDRTRRLLRKVVAGYGYLENTMVRFFMERHLTSSYRDAMRRICNHMKYPSTPPSIQYFQSLLTAPIVRRAKSMYMPRVVVVPPVSGRQILRSHKNIELWRQGKGDFYSDPKQRLNALDIGRKVIDRFPWEDCEKVWNDGEKEQDLTWEIWITDGSLVAKIMKGPDDVFHAVQKVKERQFQPLVGLRRLLALYTELPKDLSYLELTDTIYDFVCINPISASVDENQFGVSGLFMGMRDRSNVLILMNEWEKPYRLVPAMKIF